MDFQYSFTTGKRIDFPTKPIILSTIPSVCCCTTSRKLEVRILANLTLYDFSSRQRRLSFHQICGHRTVLTSTLSTMRYGASSSSESISRGCTTLMNWSSTCCMFGTALTRPTINSASDEWRERLPGKNGHFKQLLSNVTRFLYCFFVNYHKFKLLNF